MFEFLKKLFFYSNKKDLVSQKLLVVKPNIKLTKDNKFTIFCNEIKGDLEEYKANVIKRANLIQFIIGLSEEEAEVEYKKLYNEKFNSLNYEGDCLSFICEKEQVLFNENGCIGLFNVNYKGFFYNYVYNLTCGWQKEYDKRKYTASLWSWYGCNYFKLKAVKIEKRKFLPYD